MLRRFRGETRWSLLATIFVLGLVFKALTILPGQFKSEAGSKKGLFVRTVSADPALPNFDIREIRPRRQPILLPIFDSDSAKPVRWSTTSVADSIGAKMTFGRVSRPSKSNTTETSGNTGSHRARRSSRPGIFNWPKQDEPATSTRAFCLIS